MGYIHYQELHWHESFSMDCITDTHNTWYVVTQDPVFAGAFSQQLQRHLTVSLVFHQLSEAIGSEPTDPFTQYHSVNYLQGE